MKNILTFALLIAFGFCNAQNKDKATVNTMLDQWHKDAADAKFNDYFAALAPDAIYIGTDATENWNVDQFKAFAKPYFDKGKAWSFTALERNIYFGNDIAWFDELLDTQMKICRGSGILKKQNGQWKIVHYVLSMTVPNDVIDPVIKAKAPIEDAYMESIRKKK